jgi:hypothetical protein
VFYQQLFSYFKNEAELAHFNPRISLTTGKKIEMMNSWKESMLLFFEEKIYRFTKGYEMKKAY